MATSSTIQINIGLYMFLAIFLLKKKNIFHERFGFNFFPAKQRDNNVNSWNKEIYIFTYSLGKG